MIDLPKPKLTITASQIDDQAVQIETKAKRTLVKFIKNAEMGVPYKFTISGSPADARVFVQRMRVELSRLRAIVREGGRRPQKFKIHFLECTQKNNLCEVVILKTQSIASYRTNINEIAELIGEELEGYQNDKAE